MANGHDHISEPKNYLRPRATIRIELLSQVIAVVGDVHLITRCSIRLRIRDDRHLIDNVEFIGHSTAQSTTAGLGPGVVDCAN